MRTQLCQLVSLCTLLTSVIAAPAAGQIEGTLDPSFYLDGKFFLEPSLGYQTIHDVVVAPDGRLVIAGYREGAGGQSLFWAALDGKGAPTICSPPDVAGGAGATAFAATFDDQGRLLLAGAALFPDAVEGWEGIALRYLYPACDLDLTFNFDGIFRTSYTADTVFKGIAVDSDSRIVLAGHFLKFGEHAIAVRLTNTGLYDFGFAGDGHLELDFGTEVTIEALQLQADDRVVLAGTIYNSPAHYNFLALRLDTQGSLDPTFSGDGLTQVDFGLEADFLQDLAVDPVDGSLILVGWSNYSDSLAAVARLTAGGVLDTAFGGGDGRWTHSVADKTYLSAVEVQSDGKLLVAGHYYDVGEDRDLVTYRLMPSGTLDTTYGFLGAAGVSFNLGDTLDDRVNATTLHGGKLVLAGDAANTPDHSGAVARLWIALIFADGFETGSAGQWSAPGP